MPKNITKKQNNTKKYKNNKKQAGGAISGTGTAGSDLFANIGAVLVSSVDAIGNGITLATTIIKLPSDMGVTYTQSEAPGANLQ